MIIKEERLLGGSPSTTGNLRQRQKGGNDLLFGALWCACDLHVIAMRCEDLLDSVLMEAELVQTR